MPRLGGCPHRGGARSRGRGHESRRKRTGAAKRPHCSCRDPGAPRRRSGGRNVATGWVHAVRDPGTLRDVRRRLGAGQGPAARVRGGRSEGRIRRLPRRSSSPPQAQPRTRGGIGRAGGGMRRAAPPLLPGEAGNRRLLESMTEACRSGRTGPPRKRLGLERVLVRSNRTASAHRPLDVDGACRLEPSAPAIWPGQMSRSFLGQVPTRRESTSSWT
jgi:hypothetical protein